MIRAWAPERLAMTHFGASEDVGRPAGRARGAAGRVVAARPRARPRARSSRRCRAEILRDGGAEQAADLPAGGPGGAALRRLRAVLEQARLSRPGLRERRTRRYPGRDVADRAVAARSRAGRRTGRPLASASSSTTTTTPSTTWPRRWPASSPGSRWPTATGSPTASTTGAARSSGAARARTPSTTGSALDDAGLTMAPLESG